MTDTPPRTATLVTRGIAGELVGTNYEGWSPDDKKAFAQNLSNGRVGGELLYEDERFRVWSIDIGPGESLPPHCHVLDYTWIALSQGTSRQLTADGSTRVVSYRRGNEKFFEFRAGEYLQHNLENIGNSRLRFLTVEFLDGANEALPI